MGNPWLEKKKKSLLILESLHRKIKILSANIGKSILELTNEAFDMLFKRYEDGGGKDVK